MKDYMSDLVINKNKLDEEWIRQPTTFMSYCIASADSEEERDEAKREVEVARAEADFKIRAQAAEAGEKLTEAKVGTRVTLHPEVQKSELNYIKKCKEAKLLSSAVRSFDQRKKALEKLCDLYTQGYFSAPSGDKSERAGKAQTQKLKEKSNVKS